MALQQDSLKTLSNIARILQKSQPSENPLAHIVKIVREQLGVDVCSLYLLQAKTLILVATDGLDVSSVGKVRMEIREGLTGLAVEKLQPIIVNEASQHPRFKYFPETGEEKFRTFAAVPLMERQQVVGVLTIQTVQAREFNPMEIELLKVIAFQLSGVVQNLVTLEVLQQEGKSDRRPRELKGIAVAPGFGIGPAFFLRPGVQPVIVPLSSSGISDLKEEWKKLKGALEKASEDLVRLEKKLFKKFSRKISDIFYSHRMILSDPDFLKKLKEEVLNGRSASQAVNEVIGEYIQHFEKIEDPHFRERAADLEDLRQRVLEHLVGRRTAKTQERAEGILVAETLVPSDTARLDPERIKAIVTSRGGLTSHASILARSLGIPAVMGVEGLAAKIKPGDLLIVDGNEGKIFIHPERSVLRHYERIQERYADQIVLFQKYAAEPAITQDGRRISLEANVGMLSELPRLRYFGAEGVGLYRTEYPFMTRRKLPEEDEQWDHYRKVLLEAGGLPVTFRVLDAGGDKPMESLGHAPEANPFLGYRSIRLFLNRPEILETQFRALLRASTEGPVRILVPMISGIEELRGIRRIYESAQKTLRNQKISFVPDLPFGIMIEVPSAVQMVEHLVQEADFLSLGTNDLIQYTLAVDRNNEKVAGFFEPLHPAVIASIARVAEAGEKAGKRVGVCGEMAGDPKMASLLVGLGVTQLSMIPQNVPKVKKTIRQIPYQEASELARKVRGQGTVEEVKALLKPFWERLE